EAMEERQVTVAGKTYRLPDLFMVLATQNPIEQEGTYPLPEAQMDRFLMHVVITYPDEQAEGEIIRLNRAENAQRPKGQGAGPAPVPQQAIFDARGEIDGIFVSDLAQKYMVDVIFATRFPGRYGEPLSKWIQIGASPRGSLALDRCARVRAWLDGETFVTPDHVRAVMHDCLRHRLILSYEALADGGTADQVIDRSASVVAAARGERHGDDERRSGSGRLCRSRSTDRTRARHSSRVVPAAPARAQPAVRPLCLAHAWPRPQFRGDPWLSAGRRRAHHRLEGDGTAAGAACAHLQRGARPAGGSGGRPPPVDVFRPPPRPQVGHGGGSRRASARAHP